MSTTRSQFAVRVFRALARLTPVEFRERDADELAGIFDELHTDARSKHGRLAALRALLAEFPGLARILSSAWRSPRYMRPHFTAPPRRRSMFDIVTGDIRHAIRSLGRSPVFTTVCVLTLALGVGANTAIFSLVNGVLVRPLDFPGPDRLVALGEAPEDGSVVGTSLRGTTPGSFYAWQAGARSATHMAAWNGIRVTLTGFGEPESIVGVANTGDLFNVMGVPPLFGRTLRAEDDAFGAEPVVVLSSGMWQRYFGEDRDIIGRRITLQGAPTTIVGVMPSSFRYPEGSTFWKPFAWSPEYRGNRDQYGLSVVARLRPGATETQLKNEMATVAQQLRTDYAQFNSKLRIGVAPLQETIVATVRPRLYLLMGAVVCVLLIACANLANLMLARAAARRHEIAIRQALGAVGTRIVRQLMTESLLLAVAGGVAALVVGRFLMRFLVAAHRDVLPRLDEIGLDFTVLLFTLGTALIAGLLFGLAPALQLARGKGSEALRESRRTTGGHVNARRALVVSEIALALMLLVGAGLLVRSARELARVKPGFDPDRLLTFQMTFSDSSVARTTESLDRLRAIPGVRAASVTSQLPVSGRGIGAWFNILSRPTPPGETPTGEPYRVVSPEYFTTAGIPLIRGRWLTTDDRRGNSQSVLINEALARKYWPQGNPIGEEIYLGAPDNRFFDRATIVGIVGDTRDGGLRADPLPQVFMPSALVPFWGSFSFVVRTSGDPMTIAGTVRTAMHDVAPLLPIRNMKVMTDVLDESIAEDRLALMLLGAIAGVALLMAAIGIFGVLAYLVSQRTRELGIRLALGAAPTGVRRLVVMEGIRLAAVGIAIGAIGALSMNRVMSSMVFGIGTTDPVTYVAVSLGLLGVAGLASWVPARRATKVDPMLALRDS
ncbi:MAG: ABC transporter permease [Gemmatimonadaceae bacterium]